MALERFPFSARTGLPCISISVGISEAERRALSQSGLPTPALVWTNPVDALLDTGAHRSFIPESFVKLLTLIPTGSTMVHQPLAGATPVQLFAVGIQVLRRRTDGLGWSPGELLAPTVQVGLLPTIHGHRSRTFPMPIIGRDVLNHLRFTYDGPERFVEFALPNGQEPRGIWRKALAAMLPRAARRR